MTIGRFSTSRARFATQFLDETRLLGKGCTRRQEKTKVSIRPKGVTHESKEGFVGTSLAAEPLLALAVTVTSEQHVDSVLQSIVQGLASQPGVALARIWLLPSVHLPSFSHAVSDRPDCLCLVASAGTPINSPGEDWCFLQGHFARMPFSVGKVGQVAASRHPILIEDVAAQNDWVVRPEWAKREEIRSFAGHPLIFRDKTAGCYRCFQPATTRSTRVHLVGSVCESGRGRYSNACAEEALQSSERNLAAIIDTIPTLAWCNLPDGSNEFLNKGWHEYTGLSPGESHGWGWQAAFHPEDLPPLMEKWQKMLVSGESDEIEARLRRHDGVYRWFLIRAQALRNDSGKIVRWYGTSTDIEDLKQSEQGRRASERNLAAIINTIPTTAWTTRPDGYCDFLNQVLARLHGHDCANKRRAGAGRKRFIPTTVSDLSRSGNRVWLRAPQSTRKLGFVVSTVPIDGF